MRIITTLAAVAGLVVLSGCNGGAEENAAENFDANMMAPTDNMEMPADNMDMNLDVNADMNADNAADNVATNSTTY